MESKAVKLALLVLLTCFSLPLFAQEVTVAPQPVENKVVSIKPNYIPPDEILDFLGVRLTGNRGIMEWLTADTRHYAEIRMNNAANLILVSGEADNVDYVAKLIKEADIPPRQIEIEVKIVEIRKSKARDLGIDWDMLWERSNSNVFINYYRRDIDSHSGDRRESFSPDDYYAVESADKSTTNTRNFELYSRAPLNQAIRLLDEKGAGTIRNAPRILTLNNRRATILDGERVTYVTRYSSYTNLFETDSIDAGLNLSVNPSLGESGYITMNIIAELTSLNGSISGSPVKNGQMIENTVIVKDGESIFLGGLTRTVDEKRKKRFPILGHVLPFLFSREITIEEEIESAIVLTPRVVDFASNVDDRTKDMIEGD